MSRSNHSSTSRAIPSAPSITTSNPFKVLSREESDPMAEPRGLRDNVSTSNKVTACLPDDNKIPLFLQDLLRNELSLYQQKIRVAQKAENAYRSLINHREKGTWPMFMEGFKPPHLIVSNQVIVPEYDNCVAAIKEAKYQYRKTVLDNFILARRSEKDHAHQLGFQEAEGTFQGDGNSSLCKQFALKVQAECERVAHAAVVPLSGFQGFMSSVCSFYNRRIAEMRIQAVSEQHKAVMREDAKRLKKSETEMTMPATDSFSKESVKSIIDSEIKNVESRLISKLKKNGGPSTSLPKFPNSPKGMRPSFKAKRGVTEKGNKKGRNLPPQPPRPSTVKGKGKAVSK